jgi:hypothetical protein
MRQLRQHQQCSVCVRVSAPQCCSVGLARSLRFSFWRLPADRWSPVEWLDGEPQRGTPRKFPINTTWPFPRISRTCLSTASSERPSFERVCTSASSVVRTGVAGRFMKLDREHIEVPPSSLPGSQIRCRGRVVRATEPKVFTWNFDSLIPVDKALTQGAKTVRSLV